MKANAKPGPESRISHMVGNTPLLEIELSYRGMPRKIYAKAENVNLTGSIKDRMAYHILGQAYERGHLAPGGLIIEATSGNTGISFSAAGRALGHPVTIFMPDWMSRERIDLIRSFGAEINLVTKEEGGFLGSISLAEELARQTDGAFYQDSSPMKTTSRPTTVQPDRRSGGSSVSITLGRMHSSPVSERAGRLWEPAAF